MKFWTWLKNEVCGTPQRTLMLEGYIAEESWFSDDVTPQQFKAELNGNGLRDDIIVHINSPGGCVFAATQIYNALKEYPGRVTVHIDSLAASAASVVAMAGDEVCVSPLSILMIHNPMVGISGDVSVLKAGINLLEETKEGIINAYHSKTKLSRAKLAHLMDNETWMSAHKAVELGFADKILYQSEPYVAGNASIMGGFMFDRMTVTNAFMAKLPNKKPMDASLITINEPKCVSIDQLDKRLSLIKNWRYER